VFRLGKLVAPLCFVKYSTVEYGGWKMPTVVYILATEFLYTSEWRCVLCKAAHVLTGRRTLCNLSLLHDIHGKGLKTNEKMRLFPV
jgi:hypothetical protein